MQLVPARGAFVWIRQRRWRVEAAARDNAIVRLDVISDAGRQTFLSPFDRARADPSTARPRRVRAQCFRARLASVLGSMSTYRTPRSAIAAQIDILPHQLEPALAVLSGESRILIADGVGLGKTVQAGLIIAELKHRTAAMRALVLVPASLASQWIEELASRFQLHAHHAEAATLGDLARDRLRIGTPWDQPGIWIASIDYVKQPHVFDAVVADTWDVLVIDEAHNVCGDSDRHMAVSTLARRARKVVLLTATPHNGDARRFHRLTRLGAFTGDDERLVLFRRTRADLGIVIRRKTRWAVVNPSAAEARLMETLLNFERWILAAGRAPHEAAMLLLSVFRKRALSTTSALLVSLRRRAEWLQRDNSDGLLDWMQPSLWLNEDSDWINDAERASLMVDLGVPRDRERKWIERLLSLAEAALTGQSKARHIAGLLRRTAEPVIVFTEFRDSLEAVTKAIANVRDVAAVHGGMTTEEQRQQLRRFTTAGCSVLVATDVAGQGLNLQSRCRWVINLELPWNPARLEQRAGRVDRIGQTRSAHVSMLCSRHPAEAFVVARLARRVASAREALGEPVFDLILPGDWAIRQYGNLGTSISDAGFPAGIETDKRWRPAARLLARQLIHRRQLSARHQSGVSGRPAYTEIHRLPHLRGLIRNQTGLFFIVPLLDGCGVTIEERLVCVRVGVPLAKAMRADDVLAGARNVAVAAVHARVRRLMRLRGFEAARLMSREQEISDALAAAVPANQFQPGLFDRRAITSADERRRATDAIRRQLRGFRARCEQQSVITAGTPALILATGPAR